MIKVSEDFKALYKQDSTHKNYFIVFRDKGVMLNNSEIVSESLSITESICSSGNFQVGLTESAVCNVKVRMPDNVKGDEIFVFQTVGGYFEPEITYDDALGIQISGDGVTKLDSTFTAENIISGLDGNRFDPDSYYLIFAKLKYTGSPIYLYLEAPGNGNSRMIYYLKPDMFGFKNLNAWDSTIAYGIGEYVTHNDEIWESRTYENSQEPSDAGNAWANITRHVQIVLPMMGSEFAEYKLGVYINSDTDNYGAPVLGYATAYRIDVPVMPLGLFGIDSCKRDADSNLRDIVGYDRMKDVELDTDVYLTKGDTSYSQIGVLLDEAAKNTQIVIGTNLSREEINPVNIGDVDVNKEVDIEPENVYEVTKHEKYIISGEYKAHPSENDEKYTRQETTLTEAPYQGDGNGAYSCNEMQIVNGNFKKDGTGYTTTVYKIMEGKICDEFGAGLSGSTTWQRSLNNGSIIPYGNRQQKITEEYNRVWNKLFTMEIRVRTRYYLENQTVIGYDPVTQFQIRYSTFMVDNGKWSKWSSTGIAERELYMPVWVPEDNEEPGNPPGSAEAYVYENGRLARIERRYSAKYVVMKDPYTYVNSPSTNKEFLEYYQMNAYLNVLVNQRYSPSDKKESKWSSWETFSYEVGYFSDESIPSSINRNGVTYQYNKTLNENSEGTYSHTSSNGAKFGGKLITATSVWELNDSIEVEFVSTARCGYYFKDADGTNYRITGTGIPSDSTVVRMGNQGLYRVTGSSNDANRLSTSWVDQNGNAMYESCYAEFVNNRFTYGFEWGDTEPRESGCSAWTSSASDEFTVNEQITQLAMWREGVAGNREYTKGVAINKRRKRYFRTRRWNYSIPNPPADEYGAGWEVALPSTEDRDAVMGNVESSRYYADTKYNYSIRGSGGSQIGGFRWRDNSGNPYTTSNFRLQTGAGKYRDREAYEYLGRIFNRTLEYSYTFDLTILPSPYKTWVLDKSQKEGAYLKKDEYGSYNNSGDERRWNKQSYLGSEAGVIYQRSEVYALKWRDYTRDIIRYWKEKAKYWRTDYAIPEGVYNQERGYSVYLDYASDLQVFKDEKTKIQPFIDEQIAEYQSEDGRQSSVGEVTLDNREKFIQKAADETTSEADVQPGSYMLDGVPYIGGLFSILWVYAVQYDGYTKYAGEDEGTYDSSISGIVYSEKNPFRYCIAHNKAEKFNGEQIKWATTGTNTDTIKHAKRREVVNGFLNLHGMFINFDRWGVSTIRKVKASGLYPAEDLFPHDAKYTEDGETFPLLAYGNIYPMEGVSEYANTAICKSLYIEDDTNNDFDGIYIAKSSVTEEEKDLYPFYYNSLFKRYGTLPRGMQETGYWEGNNYFKIDSNFYFNNFVFTEKQLKEICAFILENVGQLKYYNMDCELRALPYLEVGDNISIQTSDNGYETAILRRTMKGNIAQMDTIETDFYT